MGVLSDFGFASDVKDFVGFLGTPGHMCPLLFGRQNDFTNDIHQSALPAKLRKHILELHDNKVNMWQAFQEYRHLCPAAQSQICDWYALTITVCAAGQQTDYLYYFDKLWSRLRGIIELQNGRNNCMPLHITGPKPYHPNLSLKHIRSPNRAQFSGPKSVQ